MTSLQLANANNNNTIIWRYCNFKPRLVSSVFIKDMIWRPIRPFDTVGDINKIALIIEAIWSHFSPSKLYTLTTTTACLVDCITLLDKKSDKWTKSREFHVLFQNTSIALTKTSPEIFSNS